MQEPERVFRKLIDEGFNAGDLDVAAEVTADEFTEHQDFGPNHAPGAEGVRAVISSLKRAFSDFHLEIQELTVAGDKAWARLVATGTHDGPFMGHPPTGRSMRIDVFDVVQVVDGRMTAHWGVPDRLGVLIQLGLLQPPAARAA